MIFGIPARERIALERFWKFQLGHATDPLQDFGHATSYFSYLAKTGYGDGPAALSFDDRAWREVRIPHDWAVQLPFDANASRSHGYRALGPRFPETSVGWYRRRLEIAETDLGRCISLEFDGIQRAARVFVNGFFLGEEKQGNLSQRYDITPYLNYGGENVVVVRADVSMEQGWYYEGAGINRLVHLVKTNPIHVAHHGSFVRTELEGGDARLVIDTTIVDERAHLGAARQAETCIERHHVVLDAQGECVLRTEPVRLDSAAGTPHTVRDTVTMRDPALWSVVEPNLYTLVTRLETDTGEVLDEYRTVFGVRSIRFDPNHGFFLNGEPVKLKGSNNHEDHAGVGTALPDALIEYRLRLLKDMGMNAYRAAHAPAAPALLDIADRIGLLVINENRLMGVNDYHLQALERMIRRDRNHPSVVLWSLGNEEWMIEGNAKGARIARTMQNHAGRVDPTRPCVVGISGGWGGISTEIQAMGVNYIRHGDTDEQHEKYPWQILVGTEETTTQQTRGIYYEDAVHRHLPPLEDGNSGGNIEVGWRHYAARPYLSGVFYWTGFDYRGEPTPYDFPANSSQFGILDSCGFPKDSHFYLKAWWAGEPLLHIARHWNWPGREGEVMEVVVYSNAEEVELFQDGKSLERKRMPALGHLKWPVRYMPGELRAHGTRAGKPMLVQSVSTTGPAADLALAAHVNRLRARSAEVAVVNVSVRDEAGRVVPTASNLLSFALEGPGSIIGVGNGDPSSLEADVELDGMRAAPLGTFRAPDAIDPKTAVVFEAYFDLPQLARGETARALLLSALGEQQTVTLNGVELYRDAPAERARADFRFDELGLQQQGNLLRMQARAFADPERRAGLEALVPASLLIHRARAPYQRRAFNGWAQVLVQAGDQAGRLTFAASGEGLRSGRIEIVVD